MRVFHCPHLLHHFIVWMRNPYTFTITADGSAPQFRDNVWKLILEYSRIFHYWILYKTTQDVLTCIKLYSSFAFSSIDTASGNRGVILHSNGIGRLSGYVKFLFFLSVHFETHTTKPSSMHPSISSGTGFPLSSDVRSMFIAHNMMAISMNKELFAT
jgi:hypothetical protein